VEIDDWVRRLRERGAVLLRDVFPRDSLAALHEVASRCLDAVAAERVLAQRYRFNPFSHSVPLDALAGFGGGSAEELRAPLCAPGLSTLFRGAMGGAWTCRMEHCWVRKKFSPSKAPRSCYHPQNWHQDGALGVCFPPEAGPVIPMTPLLTCWIPLNSCGSDSPGLEFVYRRQETLLHFKELDDAALRRRFPLQEFWAPCLQFGDGLVFLNGTLHRTYATPQMPNNRLSIEYRIFPAGGE